MLGDRVHEINAMGSAGIPINASFYVNIEIAMIEVRSRDSIAVFGEQTRRKWRAGVHLNANRSSELAIRNVFVSCDFGIVDDGLSAFFDVEDDVHLGFVIDGFGSDFYIFVSAIVIQGLQVLHALLHQLLTLAAVRPNM